MSNIYFNIILFISLNIFTYNSVNAYTEEQKNAILNKYGPIFTSCGVEANVTKQQAEVGRMTKNINSVSACYFTCVFRQIGVLKTSKLLNKEYVDPITTLALAGSVIPTLSVVNLIPITLELGKCVTAYAGAPGSDDQPGCPRTSVLVNCLAGAPVLTVTITKAVNIK